MIFGLYLLLWGKKKDAMAACSAGTTKHDEEASINK